MNVSYKLTELRLELHKYNVAYYVHNKSIISDYNFDMKMKELEKLEAEHPEFFDPNSPTQRVGSDLSNDFKTIKHEYPMLSLGNTYELSELTNHFKSALKYVTNQVFGNVMYTCELKFDGASLSLTYENNILTKAVTRGDGDEGDDVTDNVRAITSIPNVLIGEYSNKITINGEIIMTRATFNELNKKQLENGEKLYANPRNLTSGSLKLKRPVDVTERGLIFFPFQVFSNDVSNSHYESISLLSADFKLPDLRLKPTESFDEVMAFINKIEKARPTLPFDIDGAVIKMDHIGYRNMVGFTSKTPRWAISYKYQSEQGITKYKDIVYQTGKSGQITPVVNLIPVYIAGTTVTRASLYNEGKMLEMGFHEGDTLIIEKGGEIIPAVVGIDLSKRLPNAKPIKFIKQCPDCGSPIEKKKDGDAHYFCTNIWNCPSQVKGKLEYFVSKKVMNLDGLGESIIEQLYNKGLVKRIEDFYDLTENTLRNAQLEKIGEKTISNILKAIEDSKKQPYHRVLSSLSIHGVGTTLSKDLVKIIPKFDDLINKTYTDLTLINGIGETTANSFLSFFNNAANLKTIEKLKAAGLNFETKLEENNNLQSLEGLIIVISGNFGTAVRRKELEKMVSDFGGRLGSSVSNKTSYFVAGDKVGPSKLEKATQNNIPIINEEKFLELVGKPVEKTTPPIKNSNNMLFI